MSDYKRFVSYIYGYEQGEKRESTGFVKVNARGGECKIWVHVKGFYSHRQRPYQVYVFARNRERLEGQYLGELESRNGALEWSGVTRTDSLMGGFSLEESRGIYIEGENRIFAAEWDDYPVDVERFRPLERYARQARQDVVETVSAEEPEERFESPENEPPEKTAAADPEAGIPEVRAAQMTESREETAVEKDAGEHADKKEQPEETQGRPPGIRQVKDPRKQQWEYLARRFRVMRYEETDGTAAAGIRLGSRELSRIPRDKWGLGNNSFLLHGFYQYHHLLLLRSQIKEQVCYYIGVPGIYNEKEQMLASMFGFDEFKRLRETGSEEEGPGYWCRLLK